MSAGGYTRDYDTSSPLDHSKFKDQPGHVRMTKEDIAERLASFMYGFTSGETTKGLKFLEFVTQATAPTQAADSFMLYAKDVSGKAELHGKDEDANVIQITSGGKLNAAALGGVYAAADTTAVATLMNLIYPIGFVITLGVATNPATLLGIGTWTAIEGKVIVGIDGSQTEFDTLNETGGAKTHTLSVAEIPSHRHGLLNYNDSVDGTLCKSANANNPKGGYTDYVGGGGAHNNLQPYIVKYVWERTA